MKTIICLAIAILAIGSMNHVEAQIKNVPGDFQSIAEAITNSNAGDTIVLAPGTYNEKNMVINKPLTISSRWILTGDQAFIEQTVINAAGAILFSINSDDVEISGLKIINGDHTFDIEARVSIKYNHLVNNADGISMESGGGGYVGYNIIENNGRGDDNIDLDINQNGSDILIEYNEMFDANDDGIEIRLFTSPNQNIHYEIRHNIIKGSNNAGIQLISYDEYTGKVFDIHHNVFQDCKTGLGCMEGANTSEDMTGASKMDEVVYFYNNTSVGNQMGGTGGNNIIAVNNIVAGNSIGGFKMFGASSVIGNNLFYNNNNNDLLENNASVVPYDNIFNTDPLLDGITLRPLINSPCIDVGIDTLILNEASVIVIDSEDILGSAPDLGALEYDVNLSDNRPHIDVSENSYIRNYPNPFSLTTTITVNLPEANNVEVAIYDLGGRKVQILEEGFLEKGKYTFEWNGKDENGNKPSGGIYTARLKTGSFISNTRMMLIQ